MTEAPITILLADDDNDDRFFFKIALSGIELSTSLTTVSDGEALMLYLQNHPNSLPDILFLDLNMPKKNGAECLSEIKSSSILKRLKVVIYSTSFDEKMADELYNNGALLYIQKTDLEDLKKILQQQLPIIIQSEEQPPRNKFVFS